MKSGISLHLFAMASLVVLGTFSGIQGMQSDIFMPTGKPYTTQGWNASSQGFSHENHVSIDWVIRDGNPEEIKKKFESTPWLKVDVPCVEFQVGTRLAENGGGYLYPLQYAIAMRSPLSTIETILQLGSPKKFRGYNPFKHVLDLVLTADPDFSALLCSYLFALLKYGMSPTIQDVSKSSSERVVNAKCGADSSISTCIDTLITNYSSEIESLEAAIKNLQTNVSDLQTKLKAEKSKLTTEALQMSARKPIADAVLQEKSKKKDLQDTKQRVETLKQMQQIFAEHPTDTSSAIPIVSTSTSHSSSSSSTSATSSIAPTESPPKLTWQDTVSRWCKEPKPGFAKTTACIFALAAVAVATKLLYDRFVLRNTQNPSQIIVTNATDTSLTIGYMQIGSDKLISTVLNPQAQWPFDMNKIQLGLIITKQGTAQDPLSINLGHYKASIGQKHTALHITVRKTSWLQYLWSGIPYTYTVRWQ